MGICSIGVQCPFDWSSADRQQLVECSVRRHPDEYGNPSLRMIDVSKSDMNDGFPLLQDLKRESREAEPYSGQRAIQCPSFN